MLVFFYIVIVGIMKIKIKKKGNYFYLCINNCFDIILDIDKMNNNYMC